MNKIIPWANLGNRGVAYLNPIQHYKIKTLALGQLFGNMLRAIKPTQHIINLRLTNNGGVMDIPNSASHLLNQRNFIWLKWR